MTKRIFCFLFVFLVCASFIFVSVSAETETTGIAVQYGMTLQAVNHADSAGEYVDVAKNNFTFSTPSEIAWYAHRLGYDVALDDSRVNAGVSSYGWNEVVFRLTLHTNLSDYDMSKYDLVIDWSVNNFPLSEDALLPASEVSFFNGSYGLNNSNSAMFCPRFKSLFTYDIPLSQDLNTVSQSITITDYETIVSMTQTSTSWNVFLPFYSCSEWADYCSFDLRLTLREKTTYPAGDIDLGTPDSYKFDIPMTYGFISPKMYSCGISDVYLQNRSYNFRDYSDYYNLMSAFTPWYDYETLLMLRRRDPTDIGDSNAWNNSVLDVVSFDIPYTVTLPADFDLAAQKVEFLFRFRIAGAENQLNWYDLESLVGSLYNQYYDFQPYAIKVGGMSIGYKYFEMQYINTLHTLEVSLRLTSEDETQRAFIRALLENTSFRFTFSVDDDMHGAAIGICSAGFFLGDAPIFPDSTNNNFSQADIDAAFNRGYSSGLSDGSDKNYVFGFINGTWSAFNDFYKTVANGISIGGVTLSAVITSICIIVVLIFVLKKVL